MKDMEYNFNVLLERIIDSLEASDLKKIHENLNQIQDSVICVGNGGSSVVSEFASIVFSLCNNCKSLVLDSRDLLYYGNSIYKNIFISSYSGNSFIVKTAIRNNCKNYLFSTKAVKNSNITSIAYSSNLAKEKSFISLGGTLVPMTILLSYYKKNETKNIVEEIYTKCCKLTFSLSEIDEYDVMSGIDSKVATKFIESTFIESGIGNAAIHNRYDFCHGRSTFPFHHKNRTLIFLKTEDSDLTKVELECSKNLYKQTIILESNYQNLILNNFDLTMQAMFLMKFIAKSKHKNLSTVKYAPAVKELYYFKGSM